MCLILVKQEAGFQFLKEKKSGLLMISHFYSLEKALAIFCLSTQNFNLSNDFFKKVQTLQSIWLSEKHFKYLSKYSLLDQNVIEML